MKLFGPIREEYSHSTYKIKSYKITEYNVPSTMKNQIHLLSVARGSTAQITTTKRVTGRVEFKSTVGANIKLLINSSFDLSVSGEFAYEYSKSKTYTGPEYSKYTTRYYYGAVISDQYSFVLERYDVYKVYNGNTFVKERSRCAGDENVKDVLRPHEYNYFVDSSRN